MPVQTMRVKSSKRAWVDIMADILTNTSGGENVTDIMYNTRLSYAHMKEYLKAMVENGLLAYETEGRGMYRTTDRGFEYLEMYKQIKSLAFPKESSGSTRNGASSAGRRAGEDDDSDPAPPVAPSIAKGKTRGSYTSKP
jgi:predicted transcriptional regulator